MMDGYSMSGWAWLLMTLGMLGFWALVAVLAVALFRRPGGRDQQQRPDAEEILAERLARGESTPMSTASASRQSIRQPAGDDRAAPAHLAPARPRPGR